MTPRGLLALLCGAMLGGAAAAKAAPAEIWLTGTYRPFEENGPPGKMTDFMELFRPDAPWQTAAKHTKVFSTSTDVLIGAPEDQLRAMFAGLKARGIAFAAEAAILPDTRNCGWGVKGAEGYTKPGVMKAMAERIKRLGGTLDYIAMDEPLWFGHHDSRPGMCRTPIEEMARDVAAQVAAMRQVFPAMRVGDIEPIGNPEPKDWLAQIAQWSDAYRRATGEKLAFIRADVNWSGPWRPALAGFVRQLRQEGIGYGIIYNGGAGSRTAQQWARQAEEEFAGLETDPAMVPDHAMFQSWTPWPKRNLPETESGTLTNLIVRYLAAESRLTLAREGNSLAGRLTDAAGKPIAGARIAVQAIGNGRARLGVTETVTGQVPAAAASALFALRINMECRCDGPADVAFGRLTYAEPGRPPVAMTLASRKSESVGGLDRYVAAPGQQVLINTASFPVTPGANFTLTVPMQASAASADSGVVGVVFLDKSGNGIQRRVVPFAAGRAAAGDAVTGADGRFAARPPADLLRDSPGWQAEFAGSPAYRLAIARAQ
ncbi:MAG: carboxypeptidase regulatory-like domain-containing protein [Proteobacteria bacterium]|nr:carboxypeptidase regulatory-like domain-containing protein [Pseudomonadota bacterium]